MYNPSDQREERSAHPEGGCGRRRMTYAGLKTFLFAGEGKEDPRVKAAIGWIKRHYTLDENPRQKDAGLFYYLPRLCQGDGRARRRPVRGRGGQEARLAQGTLRHAPSQAGEGWRLG